MVFTFAQGVKYLSPTTVLPRVALDLINDTSKDFRFKRGVPKNSSAFSAFKMFFHKEWA